MEGKSTITQKILDFVETFISLITTGEITDKVIKLVGFLVFIVWIYCGVKLFIDARKRYKITMPLQILLGILGLITGPIGLLFYILTRPKYTQEEVDFLRTEHKFYYQQASKVVECINCGKYLPEGHEFCTNCGEQNRLRCTNCNNLTNIDDKFCFYCGFEFGDDRKENLLKAIESKSHLRIGDKKDVEGLNDGIEDEESKENILKNKLAGIIHMSSHLPFGNKHDNSKTALNFDVKTKEGAVVEMENDIQDENDESKIDVKDVEEVETKEEDEIVAETHKDKDDGANAIELINKKAKKKNKKSKSKVKK